MMADEGTGHRLVDTAQCPTITSYSNAENSYRTRLIKVDSLIASQTPEDARLLDSNTISINRQHSPGKQVGFIGHLISGGRANQVLIYLLCASLFASVLNTLLLTFVFKTIRLNDRGIQNGQVSWDEQIKSSVLELPTRLDGKSIWLQSIEAQPVVVESQQFKGGEQSVRFEVVTGDRDNQIITTDRGDNYLSIGKESSELEMGAKLLRWDLLANTSSREVDRSLLEFDAQKQWITLNLERKLRLADGDRSGSLNVDGTLIASELTGTLEEDLRVLARDGGIKCRSGGNMLLTAKSAGAKVSAADELILSSPKLRLAAERLYIAGGLQYFDSEPELDESVKVNGKQMADFEASLRAYSLLSIGGLLMASSSSSGGGGGSST